MIKKILMGAILLGLLTAGILIASMALPGVHVTVINGMTKEPIADQTVYLTYDGETTNKDTDDDGEVWLGSNYDEGYYYIETIWNNTTFSKTVWKPEGQQVYVTIVTIIE
ncbi:MAG: hypothetical protein KAW92_12195 [Candidatus Cloacimonetes bacterium]|nr:hypothetical protein [Candidatus Cloacimonadota bacterium]